MNSQRDLIRQMIADLEELDRILSTQDGDSIGDSIARIDASIHSKLAQLRDIREREPADGTRILLIEEGEMVRDMIGQMLTQAGYQVETASDRLSGLQQFRSNPSDLVVFDVGMPHEEELEQIRNLIKDFPTIKLISLIYRGKAPALPGGLSEFDSS